MSILDQHNRSMSVADANKLAIEESEGRLGIVEKREKFLPSIGDSTTPMFRDCEPILQNLPRLNSSIAKFPFREWRDNGLDGFRNSAPPARGPERMVNGHIKTFNCRAIRLTDCIVQSTVLRPV